MLGEIRPNDLKKTFSKKNETMIFLTLISVLKAESSCSVPCGGGLKV